MDKENSIKHDRQIVFYFAGIIIQLFLGLSVLIASYGKINYLGAWLLFGLYAFSMIIYAIFLPKEVIKHRSRKNVCKPRYEKVIQILLLILGYGVYVVAGIDQRYGWTEDIPWYMLLIAGIIFLLGIGIVLWSMIENPYFYKHVDQNEVHKIIDTGPYRVIRHPGYLGMMTYLAVCPIILESLYAMIPTIVLILLFIIRTNLEDRYLQNHLPGYQDYQKKVTQRLFKTYKS